jgi:N-dimethylarginine dimethylaminohydrolase
MPKVKDGETQQEYVARCIPELMKEGKTQEQAAGQCYGMFSSYQRKSGIQKSIKIIKDMIAKEEMAEMEKTYYPELEQVAKSMTVGGYESPEPGDLPESGKKILANVYAKCRRDGGDKEKCSKIAWSATHDAGYTSKSSVVILKAIENNLIKIKKVREMMPIKEAKTEPSASHFSELKIPAFLMCPPFNVDNEKANNVWMENPKAKEPINYEKAYTQWGDLKRILDEAGWVYLLPSQDGLQDEIYVANLGLFLPQHIQRDTILLSNFRSDPRLGEEQVGREFFGMNQWNDIQVPFFWEGEADLKYIGGNKFIGGYGIRSQKEAYEWMEKTFPIQIVKVKMTDERQYHFDCILFPVNKENCLVMTEIISPEDLKAIEAVTNIIPVNKLFGYGGSTNCVRAGKMILNASDITGMQKTDESYADERARVDWFERTIIELDLDPVIVNLSETSRVSGSSLSCLVMHLNWHDFAG